MAEDDTTPEVGRPKTFTDALRELAKWMDLVDEMAPVFKPDYVPDDEIQQDLLKMADRIDRTFVIGPALNDMWNDLS